MGMHGDIQDVRGAEKGRSVGVFGDVLKLSCQD